MEVIAKGGGGEGVKGFMDLSSRDVDMARVERMCYSWTVLSMLHMFTVCLHFFSLVLYLQIVTYQYQIFT